MYSDSSRKAGNAPNPYRRVAAYVTSSGASANQAPREDLLDTLHDAPYGGWARDAPRVTDVHVDDAITSVG